MLASRSDTPESLLAFSEPAIRDRILETYARFASSDRIADALATAHALLWRSVVCGATAETHVVRRHLAAMLQDAGLDDGPVEAANTAIFEELADLVWLRYGRSRSDGRRCTMLIAGAATRLAEARLAA